MMAGAKDPDEGAISRPAFLQADAEAKPPPWAARGSAVRTWLPPGATPPPGRPAPSPEVAAESAAQAPLAASPPGDAASKEVESVPGGDSAGAPGSVEGDDPALLEAGEEEPQECPLCEETRDEAAAERDELLDRLMDPYLAAAAELARAADELSTSFDDDVVTLATRLAAAIVRGQVAIDASVLTTNLQQAIAVAGPVTELTVRCHPDDAERMRAIAPRLAERASGRAVEVTVRPSPDVERGACLLLFDQGIVDARWTAQLDRLADAVRAAMARQDAGESGGAGAAPAAVDLSGVDDAEVDR